MQEGRDARLLQAHRLVRPPAGDDGVAGLMRLGRGDLFVQQGLRGEAEQTDTPGPTGQQLGGLFQQARQRLALEQGQSQHRQGATFSHRGGEFGLVRDPAHRPLHQRQAQAQSISQWRVLGTQGTSVQGELRVVLHGRIDGLEQLGDAAVLLLPGGGEGHVLPQRQQAGRRIAPLHLGQQALAHLLGCQGFGSGDKGLGLGEAGTREDATVTPELAVAGGHRLAAGEAAQVRLQLGGQR